MIPKIPKNSGQRVHVSQGRYDFGSIRQAVERLNEIARASNKRTETEKRVSRMAYSIQHDFRAGFSGRKHGDDAKSIAKKQLEWLQPRIETERTEVKIAQLRAEVEVIRDLLMHKERALAECDHSRGSGEYHKRQALIRAVLAKSAG